MFATISTFGWVHTLVSLSAIGFGLYAFVKEGRVNRRTSSGKWYLGTMLFGSVTAFGFFSHGFTSRPRALARHAHSAARSARLPHEGTGSVGPLNTCKR